MGTEENLFRLTLQSDFQKTSNLKSKHSKKKDYFNGFITCLLEDESSKKNNV